MRRPVTEFTARGWRVHQITRDFTVADVWDLPTPGGPGDFARLVGQFGTGGAGRSSALVRGLFAVRWRIGGWFGWDEPETGLDTRVPSLRDRLPDGLQRLPRGPDLPSLPFLSVFQADDEWVAETANQTVHGVLHVGWVRDGDGADTDSFHGQMTVLVRPNGRLGRIYLALIAPVRRHVIYPRLIRAIGRRWAERGPG